jgi:hypothetical protein
VHFPYITRLRTQFSSTSICHHALPHPSQIVLDYSHPGCATPACWSTSFSHTSSQLPREIFPTHFTGQTHPLKLSSGCSQLRT